MAENQDPALSGKTGHGKRPGALPAVLLYDFGLIALDVNDQRCQQPHADSQEENPFWRDKAEAILHALAALTGTNQNGGSSCTRLPD
jgi:hypothetical protein